MANLPIDIKNMKIKFYHIDTDIERTPTFRCINYKGKLYPISDLANERNGKIETFIQGIGWKKLSNKKVVEVPRFSLRSEDWKDYINKYGHPILFYSLTDKVYGSFDACLYNAHMEFNAVLDVDIEKYQQWLDMVYKLQELCLPYLKDYEKKVRFPWKFIEEQTFIPHYTLSASGCYGSIPFSPTLNPMIDERKLDSLYWKLGLAARGEEEDPFVHAKEISDMMADDKKWPVSIKDKMIKMFSKEIADFYEEILTFDLYKPSKKAA